MTGAPPDRPSAAITLMGKDRRGVVARITQFLFESGANIESLQEEVSRGQFRMSLVASWSSDKMDARRQRKAESDLRRIGAELKMETRVRFHRPGARQRMAILVTREPHCLEALIRTHAAGSLKADPVVVIANRKDLAPVARKGGIPFQHVPWNERARAETRLLKLLDQHEVDFIVLARFMKILSPELCWRYRNRILNVHPSLLPSFPGAEAYRQAWEKGVRVVGVTAHFVTPDLDQGPIIHQEAFAVSPRDSVEEIKARGRDLEARVLLAAIDQYLTEELEVHWGRVWG